jgi:hypothetical protein
MNVMTEAQTGAPATGRAGLEPTYEGDFVLDRHLLLESGRMLANPTLHYAVYGRLSAAHTPHSATRCPVRRWWARGGRRYLLRARFFHWITIL